MSAIRIDPPERKEVRGVSILSLEFIRTDNFSDIRHKQVATFRESFVSGYFLHVERLQFLRESIEEYRDVELIRHLAFGSLGNIITNSVVDQLSGFFILSLDTMLNQILDGVFVVHSHEWAFRLFKFGV
jgi:hypothetical protein